MSTSLASLRRYLALNALAEVVCKLQLHEDFDLTYEAVDPERKVKTIRVIASGDDVVIDLKSFNSNGATFFIDER